jgi:hypothetical protein
MSSYADLPKRINEPVFSFVKAKAHKRAIKKSHHNGWDLFKIRLMLGISI